MIPLLAALAFAQPAPPPPPPAAAAFLDVLERRDELMALLRQHDPQQHDRMTRLEQRDPQAFALALLKVERTVDRLQDDPEAAERFRAIHEETERIKALAKGYPALTGADQRRRREELEASAKRILALKQQERRARVEELRAKIAEIEADIEARDRDADRLVDAYVEQLLAERVDL